MVCELPHSARRPTHIVDRLPKIKAWIDENNPGDPLIPFSVALEERLYNLSEEELAEEAKNGAVSTLPKITTAGYTGLDVSYNNAIYRLLLILIDTVNSLLHLWTG